LAAFWIASVHTAGVAYVSYQSPEGALGLRPALASDAETIVLLTNYSISAEFDDHLGKPLHLNR
jgi:hypothetical protein